MINRTDLQLIATVLFCSIITLVLIGLVSYIYSSIKGNEKAKLMFETYSIIIIGLLFTTGIILYITNAIH